MSWLHLYAAVQISDCNFAQWTAGASRRPVFPAPSFTGGKATKQSSGETSRESAKVCRRLRCELEERRYSLTLRHCDVTTPGPAGRSNRGKLTDTASARLSL